MAEYHDTQRTKRQRRPLDWLMVLVWALLFIAYLIPVVIAAGWA